MRRGAPLSKPEKRLGKRLRTCVVVGDPWPEIKEVEVDSSSKAKGTAGGKDQVVKCIGLCSGLVVLTYTAYAVCIGNQGMLDRVFALPRLGALFVAARAGGEAIWRLIRREEMGS